MSTQTIATLGQDLQPGQTYSSLLLSGPLTAALAVGYVLQLGPDAGPSLTVVLAQAANPGDQTLYVQPVTPASNFGPGTMIVDPTSSTGAGLTGNRPTGVSVGAQFYDTTLGKPIWWNGSVWKDAAGTTV